MRHQFRKLDIVQVLKEGAASGLLFFLGTSFLEGVGLFLVLLHLFYLGFQKEGRRLLYAVTAFVSCTILVFLGVKPAMLYALGALLPACALCSLYHLKKTYRGKVYWYPQRQLFMVAFGVTAVNTVVYMLQPELQALLASLQDSLGHVSLEGTGRNREHMMQAMQMVRKITPYIPGITGVVYLLMTLGAAGLAQFMRVKFGTLVREPIFLKDLYLPWGFWYGLIGGVFTSFVVQQPFLSSIVRNLTILFLGAFFVQGLSIWHSIMARQKNSFLFLVISYVIMLFFPWLFILTLLAGLLEPWLGIRERFRSMKE